MTFQSLPLTTRTITATEARLQRIYDAAKIGLKGDALALASGLLPEEYRRLCQMDPIAEMAAQKGRADGEQELATIMMNAAKSGDTKAALEVLRHRFEWVAKQQVQIDVAQQISIIGALEQAEQRVIDVQMSEVANGLTEHAALSVNGRVSQSASRQSTVSRATD